MSNNDKWGSQLSNKDKWCSKWVIMISEALNE